MQTRLILAALWLTIPALAGEAVKLQTTPVEPVRFEKRGAVCFADFGKAAYGNLQITFASDVPAATNKVRLGEKLAADGTIERKPPGSVNFREVSLTTQPGKRVYKLD